VKALPQQLFHCIWCGCDITSKDVVGINRKLLSENTSEFYCLDCFAEYLGCEVQDILQKIKDFKEDGCKLFE